jgi:acetyl-CoA C-acetyltransferase
MVEAYLEAMADAGVDVNQIQAAWFSTAIAEQHVGNGGTLSPSPCAFPTSGHPGGEFLCQRPEAFRGAVYAAPPVLAISLALGARS